jgi:hypothetical protein
MDTLFAPLAPELDALLAHHTDGVLQEGAALLALEATVPEVFFQSAHIQCVVEAKRVVSVKTQWGDVLDAPLSAHTKLSHTGFVWEVTSSAQAIQSHLQALARLLSEHASGFARNHQPVFAFELWGQGTSLRLWLRTSDWVARQTLTAPHHSVPASFSPQDLLRVCRLACAAKAGSGDRWSFGWNLFHGSGDGTTSAVAQDAASALAWMATTANHAILFGTQSGVADLVRHHPGAHDLIQTLRR